MNTIRFLVLCVALGLLGGCAPSGEKFEWGKGLNNFDLGVDHVVENGLEGSMCSVTSSLRPHQSTLILAGEKRVVKHGLLPDGGVEARLTARCCFDTDVLWVLEWDATIGRPSGKYHLILGTDYRRVLGYSPQVCESVRGVKKK